MHLMDQTEHIVDDEPRQEYLPSPLMRLDRLFPDSPVGLHAKLDCLQLSGSTKERTAASLLAGLVRDGLLQSGGTVVESTSGNLGIALARQCAISGFDFIAVVDERANEAACRAMKAYGAKVALVATPADGNRLEARVQRVRSLLDEVAGSVTTNQYGNPDNPEAHARSTFPEIVAQLGRVPSHVYVATSTTGTLLGFQHAITRGDCATALVGVDAEGSALFGGDVAERMLPGLGAGFETALSKEAEPDAVHRIPEPEMVLGCRLLARREGILAGASTGAIIAALGRDLNVLPQGASVVILVHDTGLPYLPTVYNDEWVAEKYGTRAAKRALDDRANPFGKAV